MTRKNPQPKPPKIPVPEQQIKLFIPLHFHSKGKQENKKNPQTKNPRKPKTNQKTKPNQA